MDAAVAQMAIRNRAALRAVVLGAHLVEDETMADDEVTFADVINVLANATTVVFQPGGVNKWKAYGPLVNGDEYAVIVEVLLRSDRLFIVTTHNPP